ncbi:DUF5681 domain-containing protein [Klebsiella variicola]|uniref:DUF5681 domain-containing protein n=1 Tax=Klebsiella variicola TaxID=244366 RepID=UPI0034D1950A
MAAPENRQKQVTRNKRGQLAKGNSGNPGGRPKTATELRNLLAEGAEFAAEAILKKAHKGDMAACRIILERIVPPSKPILPPTPFDLDDSDPQSLARSVMKAIAAGTLSADQGKVILDGLASMMKVIEITELEERIARLEGEHNE